MMGVLKTAVACLACLLVPLAGRTASLAVQTGDILIVNHGDNSVYRINPTSGDQRKLGGFQVPTDLAVSPDGYLYISEYGGTIQRLNLTNGTLSVVNPLTTLWNVNGLALGPTGDLYVTCASSNSVVRINAATGVETEITRGNLLSVPIGIDFLDADNLVVSSLLGNRVVKVTLPGGDQSTLARGANGIDQPWGIAVDGTDIYVAAKDSKLLQRISGTTVTTVRQMPSPMFGIGIETNGDIVVGEVVEVARVSPAGVLVRTFPGAYNEITGVEVSRITVEAVGVTNTPPLLAAITNQTVDENTLVTFAATATDTNWPPQVWSFSLAPGAPTGAAITTNGVFTWTPNEDQGPGPGPYPITVIVTDDGDPPLSASNTFTVTVNEVNTAPSIQTITNRSVTVGDLLTVDVLANDADRPAQTLAYELLPEVPAGASISPTGVFTWTPLASQAPNTNVITVKVTDDGTPPLSATNSFTVVVLEVNVPPVLNTITNRTVNEGSPLLFTITATDANRPAQSFVFSLEPGFPDGVTLSPDGQFAWTPAEAQGPSNYVITVKVTDNGAPPLSDTTSFAVQVNEVNTAPVLETIGQTNVLQGKPLSVTLAAADSDLPPQLLAYGFASPPPAGAGIADGVFTWTPTASQAPSTNIILLKVTDNGSPPLSATNSLTVVVNASFTVEVGDILVADFGAGAVLKVNPVTGALQHLKHFAQPTDLALAPNGDLYVSEIDGTIKQFNLTNGTMTVVRPGSALSEVWGLVLAPASGELFLTSAADDSIVRVDPVSKTESVLSPIPPQANLLSGPCGLDFLDADHLVVSSFSNDRLVSVALADGAQTLLVETNGIAFPWGVAASSAGIYVTAWNDRLLQRVSGGVVTNLLLTEGATQGLALETNGAVLVGVSDLTTTLLRFHPDGTWSNLVASGLTGPITGIEVSRYRIGVAAGTNTPPVPTNFALAAVRNQPVSFSASKLATDPDGDPLTFGVSTPSLHGGTVTLLAGVVTYTPAADFTGSDAFSYTVNDGRGGAANGTVTVTVNSGLAVSLNVIYGPVITNDQFVVRFAGVPGCAYTLEASTNLTSWLKVTNLVAPILDQGWGVGVCQFTEPVLGVAQRYYRTVDPAY